jgi:hypothetical protein
MKQLLIIPCILFFVGNIKGQSRPLTKDDKWSSYYDKTDFSIIDTVDLWAYRFEGACKEKLSDSVQALGRLSFFREKTVYDSARSRSEGRLWNPVIEYTIYKLSDSAYCMQRSTHIRLISNCLPPSVGGDYFILGGYIFLNENVCLSCINYATGIDYCRPVVNYVISKVNRNKVATLEEIFNQFQIHKGVDIFKY